MLLLPLYRYYYYYCYYYYYYYNYCTTTTTAVVLYTEITLLFAVVVSRWIGFVFICWLRVDAGIYIVCHFT